MKRTRKKPIGKNASVKEKIEHIGREEIIEIAKDAFARHTSQKDKLFAAEMVIKLLIIEVNEQNTRLREEYLHRCELVTENSLLRRNMQRYKNQLSKLKGSKK